MGAPWEEHPSFELVGQASEVAGRDLRHLLLEADQETLTRTDNAQLSTFVLSLVVLDAAERVGLEPSVLAGHSLGEYSALVASGALDYEDGVRLVAERGAAMQNAAEETPGTMAAVLGLEDDAVEAACLQAEGDVWVANYNAPGQVVIAGTAEAVAEAGAIAKETRGKVLPLPVGGAFHTPLMSPARDRLRKALADTRFVEPEPPVVANVDARPHAKPGDWARLLSAQLCSPVRWRQTVEAILASGAQTVVELGPGGVLTGLARRMLPTADTVAVSVATPDDLDKLIELIAGHSPALHAAAEARTGERFHISERLILSPAAGLFTPDERVAALVPGPRRAPKDPVAIEVGGLIGVVGGKEVRSPFEGSLEGVLVLPGERVTTGQPVAWLRAVNVEAMA